MRKKGLAICLLLLLLFCFPMGVFADTGPPKHEISVTYFSEGKPISDIPFSLYYVGSFQNKELVWEQWSKGGSDYELLSSDGALFLQEQAKTIEPNMVKATNASGVALFSNVAEGVYLVTGESYETEEGSYTISPMWAIVDDSDIVLLDAKHLFVPKDKVIDEPPASEIPKHTPQPPAKDKWLPQTGAHRDWVGAVVVVVIFGCISGFAFLRSRILCRISLCFSIVGLIVLLFIFLSDAHADDMGEMACRTILEQWPDMPVEELESDHTEVVRANGNTTYIGMVTIPKFSLVLPVNSTWSNANAKSSPCRWHGSVDTSDMIIAAHNYSSHFGKLSQLEIGDSVFFMDALGNNHTYRVIETEVLEGTDVDKMKAGDWDLTLFTCTYGGKRRVTVRLSETKSTTTNQVN